ncbi:ABC transporter permease [Actinotalea subterranea]|uniref:ABC transporter permease n=1 Tax=Actinotalea subterranea TaxID=2607497 RepID=UPI0011EC5B31|nr:FtsX-like permease family protein [Actinotalea subterranea]
MGRVALRGIRAHLVRFLLSVLAVALGVAFVAGTFSLRTMLSSTFNSIVETTMLGDAYARGALEDGAEGPSVAEGGDVGGARERIPLTLVEELEAVDGVATVVPDIAGQVVLVGADGTAVINTQAPSFGMAYDPDDPTMVLSDGRAPATAGEVALETVTMESAGLAIGDSTTVIVGGALVPVEVVGEISGSGPLAGATITTFDEQTALEVFAPDGKTATIAVYAEDGVDQAELVDAIESVAAADDAEVLTGDLMREEASASIEEALGFVETFLLVFAAISLFVGAFIIANTFTMSVRQRMRELALLRAVGASPTQVFASVLIQAAVVGVLGSLAGVAGGLGLVSLLRVVFEQMGMDLTGSIPLDGFTVVVSVLIGTVVSVVAAALPARRAALVPPVEAMRDDVADVEHSLRTRAVVGLLLLVLGGATVAFTALAPDSITWVADNAGVMLGVGAGAVVIGMLAIAPVIARTTLRIMAAPFVAGLKPIGTLARGNVTRNPRRTASTAGALMIGMALVGAASVLAASTQASTATIVEDEFTGDLIVQSATYAIPQEAIDTMADVDGVGSADAIAFASVRIAAEGEEPASDYVIGVETVAFDRALNVTVVDGDLASLDSGEAAVKRADAENRDWQVGDELTVSLDGASVTVPIGAIIDTRALGSPVILPMDVYERVVPATASTVDTVIIEAADGVAVADLQADLTETVKPYVILSVMDQEAFASTLADQVDQVLTILYALLGLSIVIAVLGIVNTLALSVIERTREIGLLRAVGLGRLQLAGTVTIESVLTAVFGTVTGVLVGVGLASALPAVYADEGLTALVIPWASLGWMLALAVVVGMLAAVWPAVRAARLPVLEAVSYE